MKVEKHLEVVLTLTEAEVHKMHRLAIFLRENYKTNEMFGQDTAEFIKQLEELPL
jgi:hypothetical protein